MKKEKCKECGLKIRGGNIERHKKGFHHQNRLKKK